MGRLPTTYYALTMLRNLFSCFLLLLCTQTTQAQTARTFQNFFLEGSHVGSVYGDVGFDFSDFDGGNVINLGGQVGFPIGRSFELGVALDFITIDPEVGNNRSGLSDLAVIGRYLVSQGETDISVGGGLTLPVGDEDVGQGEGININVFGALRHMANRKLGITGVFGVDFIEQNDDYDASLRLGGGLIYRSSPKLQLIGELSFLTDVEYALLSFGVDYRLNSGARLRPALGLGVDDGAPDFELLFRFLFL